MKNTLAVLGAAAAIALAAWVGRVAHDMDTRHGPGRCWRGAYVTRHSPARRIVIAGKIPKIINQASRDTREWDCFVHDAPATRE